MYIYRKNIKKNLKICKKNVKKMYISSFWFWKTGVLYIRTYEAVKQN